MDISHPYGLCEAVAAIHRGQLTSVALTRACLDRIAVRDGQVGAWAWLDPDLALAKAEKSDQDRVAGCALGPLAGIPLGVKDIMRTRGIPTGMGSAIFADFIPDDSAAVVERIEAAGASVLGKTVTAELAYYTPGKTRNPFNGACTPGGSSSGSAAAVAAGMVPGALGTQTNGSVIRPAAFCGVVGFKPSAGLIPRAGIQAFSPSLDQVGVFSRRVEDAGLLASILVDLDLNDPLCPWPGAVKWASGDMAVINALRHPPRLIAVRQPVWDQAEAAQQQMFGQNLAALRRAGAVVEERELPPPFGDAHTTLNTIMSFEAAHGLQSLQEVRRPLLSPALNRLIDEGLCIAPAAYAEALEQRAKMAQMLAVFLDEADAIVTPPATGEAPATLMHTGNPAFCTIWSLVGAPALTFPVGLGPRHLPLGLQLVGGPLSDPALLAAAAWCEKVLGYQGNGGYGA